MKISIINGPNLHNLGTREPNVYGDVTMEKVLDQLNKKYGKYCQLYYYQSNHEGAIIDKLYDCDAQTYYGIILNAGALTHTSIAIADAISSINIPVVEVHISNVYKREKFRQHSFTSPNAKGIITGFGIDVYRLGVLSLLTDI
ncbi:MAG: type II 3-dehydroquinate dehydratase [Bacteroidota bacterium]|nr:type II 3-dehydroquinate dehydratase [Bacteroidota bacterium]